MRVNPRSVLAIAGSAVLLKQNKDARGGRTARGAGVKERTIAASVAVLGAGGLYVLFRRGQRSAQASFDGGAQPSTEVESTVVFEERVSVIEEPGPGLTSGVTSGNGRDLTPRTSGESEGSSGATSGPGSSEVTTPHREGHPGGVPEVIASPEAVVDPGATPDPIVSPEPALPRQTGGAEPDERSKGPDNRGDTQSPGS